MADTIGEMTLTEMYIDPLILSVMRADGVALAEFKEIMFTAASSLRAQGGTIPQVKKPTIEPASSSRRTQVATMQPLFASSFQSYYANL